MVTAHHCGYCHAPATKCCGACRKVFYCSANHQTMLWKYHRLICGQDESKRLKCPPLQLVEAPMFYRFTNGLNTLVKFEYTIPKVKVSYVEIELDLPDKTETEKSIATYNVVTPLITSSPNGRCRQIKDLRMIMMNMLSIEGRADLFRRSGLLPYYLCDSLYGTVEDSAGTIYYHPLFLEYFTYHTLTDIIDRQQAASDANNFLIASLERLKVLTQEAEEKAYDLDGVYRQELDITIIHANSTFSAAVMYSEGKGEKGKFTNEMGKMIKSSGLYGDFITSNPNMSFQ